jgi:P-type E1-E2 ATPase
LLLAVIPPLFLGIGNWEIWKTWLTRACVFLVVSCPCALVVSVPLSFFGGIGGASKDGILIKGAGYMEVLSKIDTVVFDKTGTLTKNRMTVMAFDVGDETLMEEIYRNIATNSTVELTTDDDGKLMVIGNPTEGALLMWLNNRGIDYATYRAEYAVVEQVPFSSET